MGGEEMECLELQWLSPTQECNVKFCLSWQDEVIHKTLPQITTIYLVLSKICVSDVN